VRRIVLIALAGVAVMLAAFTGPAPAELKATEFGKGSTIVMVHGLGGARMTWLPVARKLMNEYHVVMLDLPGHGDSPLPDPFSIEACGAELAAALAKYDAKSTVLVGLGAGGLVALQALDKKPDAVAGLVLVEATARSPMDIPDQQQRFFMQQLDTQYEGFMRMLYDGLARDSAQAVKLRADAMRVEPRHIKAYMRYMLKVDASGAFKKIRVPVMAVVSDRRWPKDRPWAEIAAELGYSDAPKLDVRRVSNSGYMVHMDQPDSLAALIGAFSASAVKP
jgi:pimeloyl-ACP methyl ester carboxylesterase